MIIVISAKAGHGKDTVSNIMIQHFKKLESNVKRIGMADKLKLICNDVYQVLKPFFKDDYQFEKLDNTIKQKNMDFGRAFWTSFGFRLKQHISQYIWLDAIFNNQFKRKYLNPSWSNVAILPDVRFKNQFIYFQDIQKFAVLKTYSNKMANVKSMIIKIKIWRPGDHPIAGFLGTSQQKVNDISQINLDDMNEQRYDYVITNDGDLNTLKLKTINIIKDIIK